MQSILLQRPSSQSPTGEPFTPGPTAAAAEAAAAAATVALDGTLDPSVAAVEIIDEDSDTTSSVSPSNNEAAAAACLQEKKGGRGGGGKRSIYLESEHGGEVEGSAMYGRVRWRWSIERRICR